jgi:urease accessory protein
MKDQITSTLSMDEEIVGGASVLPYDSGFIVRLLGDRASQLRKTIFDVIRITRKTILNPEFAGIRKD